MRPEMRIPQSGLPITAKQLHPRAATRTCVQGYLGGLTACHPRVHVQDSDDVWKCNAHTRISGK